MDREHMHGVFFIPFPKPKSNENKCKRWIAACGRENFTVDNIKKWTYICSKHFVGGKGPTENDPDPIPATYTPAQVFSSLFYIKMSNLLKHVPYYHSNPIHVLKNILWLIFLIIK